MKLVQRLDSEERRAGAWIVAGWFDTMAEARGMSLSARIVCRAAGRLLRRELLGQEPTRIRSHAAGTR